MVADADAWIGRWPWLVLVTSCAVGEPIDISPHARDASIEAGQPAEGAEASGSRHDGSSPPAWNNAAFWADAAGEHAGTRDVATGPIDAAGEPAIVIDVAAPDSASSTPDAAGCPGFAGLSPCETCVCLSCADRSADYRTCEADPKCRSIIECAAQTGCTLDGGGCYTAATCRAVIDAADGPYGSPFAAATVVGSCAAACGEACAR